nr:probable serine/threonine-protein kinase kinX isoform X1 [Ipomoea batatas]
MSSPTSSQIPDPEIPTQDETSNSHQRSQTETLEEEESQNLDNPQDQEVADQEDPKSHPEENPDEEFLGEALPLPPAIHVAVPPMGGDMLDAPLPSPANPNRRAPKRKKGKFYAKKQQAIDKKLSTLLGSLNPIPFVPSKILDFSKHEKLMKQLGLWEFVHIEFDQNIRVDLVAQLVASYDPRLRCSYVNERRIQVSRADLGRALKLHVKKEKGGANLLEGVDLDGESLPDESVAIIEDFVSNWVLLHEDAWIMPSEVLNWTKFIKDKHPEKVDWAGLFWFMVEKELIRGEKLEDCYYAAHLQCLIKSQREVLFSEEPDKGQNEEGLLGEETEKVQHESRLLHGEGLLGEETEKAQHESRLLHGEGLLVEETEKVQHESRLFIEEPADVEEVKEVDVGAWESDVKVGGVAEGQEEGTLIKELNVELTLGQDVHEIEMGQDVQEMEDVKDAEMMDFEEHVEEEQEEGEERGPFLQKCMKEGMSLDENEQTEGENEELEEEDEEQEGEDGLAIPPMVDPLGVGGDGHAENYLEAMETTQIALDSHGHLPFQSSVDILASRTDLNSGGTFFDHGGKRGAEHDDVIGSHSLGGNKRLRMDSPWDNKSLDFGTCIEQMEQLMTRAKMLYEAKEQNEQDCNMYNQYLSAEVQKRDHVINSLHKETQKRDQQIFRLERELFMMGNILEGYRKALKNTHVAFAEYRLHAQLPEEPVYKDAGPGGLVLSTTEIEKIRCAQEEEYRSNCLMLELKAKEVEEDYVTEFEMHMNKVLALDNRLTILSDNMKELKEMHDNMKELKRKAPETQQISVETPND